MKKIVNKNYKFIIGLIVGVIVSATVVYASQSILSSSDISYSNETSAEKTVQGAIDELYQKVKPCKVSKGTGINRGDEINCGTENFYVISNSNDLVTMFSKYNLDIGNNGVSTTFDFSYSPTNNTGIQNGMCTGSEGYYNGQKFDYTCFIYQNCCDNLSTTDIINKYKEYLINSIKLDKQNTSVSVPDYEFLKNIGCTINLEKSGDVNVGYEGNCKNSDFPWIYSTAYYFVPEKLARGYANRMWVDLSGDISRMSSPYGGFGIRPIVVISKKDINY